MTTSTTASPPRPITARIAEVALPTLAVLVTVIAPLVVWNRLPDPVASHWGGSGPDGSLGRLTDLLVLALATTAMAYGPLIAARFPMPRSQAQLLIATASAGSVLLAGLRLASLSANLDAARWQEAEPLGGTTIAAVVAAAVLAFNLGWFAASSRPDPPRAPTIDPAAVPVRPGEAVVWTGGASGRTPVLVAVVLLVIAAVGALVAPPETRTVLVVVLPVVALAVAAFGQARTTIGPRGVTVACGWLGFPRLQVPIEDVSDVVVEDVTPMSYGGWGLRQVPGATAVVVRRGEALRIERHRGRAFVVTVDGAPSAAGVLLAHRDAGTGPGR